MSNSIYGISDAARLTRTSEGTLRDYDKRGIVTPLRDSQGRRLFTDDHISAINKYRAQHGRRK